MRKLLLLASVCALPSFAAGPISFGVLGGVPFTDVVNNPNQIPYNFISTSSNYTVGPSVQFNLPLNLRLEFDALYRPYSFDATARVPLPSGVVPPSVSASQWAFPMLVQYRFKFPVLSPFVEAGLSVDHVTDISVVGSVIKSGTGSLIHQTNAGFVIGGGVDVKIPIIRISGELRYTRQGTQYFENVSELNQAEFLVGVHF